MPTNTLTMEQAQGMLDQLAPSALVNQLLDLSPPVAFLLALNSLLFVLRKTPQVPNWSLQWVALLVGTLLYPQLTDPAKVSFAVASPVVAQHVTGFLIGFAAIGTNKWFRDRLKQFGFSSNGDTTFTTKPPAS